MNIQQKFETVRTIMKNYPEAEFNGTEGLIWADNENVLHQIRLDIIRAGIDEVYDIIYYKPFEKFNLSLHLTKGRSW